MLKDFEWVKSEDKDDLKTETKRLREQLITRIQALRDKKLPVLVLIEGWAAAGKGSLINELISELDPRFYNVVTPVAEPESDQTVFVTPAEYIGNIPDHRLSYRRRCSQVSSDLPKTVWNLGDNGIPRGSVPTVKTPIGSRRHGTRHSTLGVLRKSDVVHPFGQKIITVKIHEHMDGRNGGVRSPTVFFAVRTVRGNMEHIRKSRFPRNIL